MYPVYHGALWLVCVFLSGVLCAQEPPPSQSVSASAPQPASVTREIYLPYKNLDRVLATTSEGRGVFLPQSQLEEILGRMRQTEAGESLRPTVSIESSECRGFVRDEILRLEWSLTLTKSADVEWGQLILGPRRLPIVSAEVNPAHLVAAGENTELWLSAAGAQEVRLELHYPIHRGEQGDRRVNLILPRFLGEDLTMDLPGTGWEVSTEPPVAWTRRETDESTKLSLVTGGLETVAIQWSEPAAIEPRRSVRSVTHARIHEGHAEIRCRAELTIQQAPSDRLRLALPQGHQFLELEAPLNGRWALDGQILTVFLPHPLIGKSAVAFTCLAPMSELPLVLDLSPYRFEDCHHQHGEVHLWRSQEIAAGEFVSEQLFPSGRPEIEESMEWAGSFRYAAMPVVLQVPIMPARSRLAIESRSSWTVTPEKQTIDTSVRYRVTERPTHTLTLKLPADFDEVTVKGEAVSHHRVVDGTLQVTFRKPQSGEGEFVLRATRAMADDAEGLQSPLITFPESVAHDAYLAVFAGGEWRMTLVEPGDLIPVDASHALLASTNQGNNAPRFGFRYRGAIDSPAIFQMTPRPSRIAVDVGVEFQIEEHELVYGWQFRYDIAQAPVRALYIAVPLESAEAFHLEDERLSEVVRSPAEPEAELPEALADTHACWKLLFRDRLRGEVILKAELRRALETNVRRVVRELPHVRPIGVASIKGTIGVFPQGSLDVETENADRLEGIDPSELPRKNAVQAYRFRQSDYQLGVAIERHEHFAVPRVMIPYSEMNVSMAADGGTTTEWVLLVKNRTERHLEVMLPRGVRLATDVLVDGETQVPRLDEDSEALVMGLPVKEDPVTVRLLYHLPPPPRKSAAFEIPVPSVTNGRVLRSVMGVHLPSSRRYRVVETSMRRVMEEHGWNRFREFCQALVPALGARAASAELSVIRRPAALRPEGRKEWASFRSDQSRYLQFYRLGAPAELRFRSYPGAVMNALEAVLLLLAIALAWCCLVTGRGSWLVWFAGIAVILSGLVPHYLIFVVQMFALVFGMMAAATLVLGWWRRLRRGPTVSPQPAVS